MGGELKMTPEPAAAAKKKKNKLKRFLNSMGRRAPVTHRKKCVRYFTISIAIMAQKGERPAITLWSGMVYNNKGGVGRLVRVQDT